MTFGKSDHDDQDRTFEIEYSPRILGQRVHFSIVSPSTRGEVTTLRTVVPGWFDWSADNGNKAHNLFDLCVGEGKDLVPGQRVVSETQCTSFRDRGDRILDLFDRMYRLLTDR